MLKAVLAGGILGILLIFIVGMLRAPTESGSSPSQHPALKTHDDAAFQRAILGARALRKAMRDPDSFELTRVFIMPNGSACLDYRARNGFGGVNSGHAVLGSQGAPLMDEGAAGFAAAWKTECAGKQGLDRTWGVNYAMQ